MLLEDAVVGEGAAVCGEAHGGRLHVPLGVEVQRLLVLGEREHIACGVIRARAVSLGVPGAEGATAGLEGAIRLDGIVDRGNIDGAIGVGGHGGVGGVGAIVVGVVGHAVAGRVALPLGVHGDVGGQDSGVIEGLLSAIGVLVVPAQEVIARSYGISWHGGGAVVYGGGHAEGVAADGRGLLVRGAAVGEGGGGYLIGSIGVVELECGGGSGDPHTLLTILRCPGDGVGISLTVLVERAEA